MRCVKSYKFWHIWTVLFHLWNGMDRCVKIYIYILFIPLSSLLLFFLSLSYFFSSFFHRLLLALVTPSSLFLLLSSPASSQWLQVLFLFFFLSLSLFLSFPVMKKKAIPIWSRARRLKLANLKLCSSIWSSARPGAVADLCSSLSTALIANGWLSLVIDWFVRLGFCWRFWVFFFFLVEVFGFGICWRIRWLWL